MRSKNIPSNAKKRPPPVDIVTPPPKVSKSNAASSKEDNTSKFVRIFFKNNPQSQREILSSIPTDQRVSTVLPHESCVATWQLKSHLPPWKILESWTIMYFIGTIRGQTHHETLPGRTITKVGLSPAVPGQPQSDKCVDPNAMPLNNINLKPTHPLLCRFTRAIIRSIHLQ